MIRLSFPGNKTSTSSSCMKASLTLDRSSLVKDHAWRDKQHKTKRVKRKDFAT